MDYPGFVKNWRDFLIGHFSCLINELHLGDS